MVNIYALYQFYMADVSRKNKQTLRKFLCYDRQMKDYHKTNMIVIARQHYEQGNLIKAKKLYEKALSSGIIDTDWMLELALLYDELGSFSQAKEIYEKVLKLNDKEAVAHYGIAILYDHQDQFALAVPHYLKAIQCDASFLKAHFFLAYAYDQLGEKNEGYQSLPRSTRH